jgi:hypothetical protein
MACEYLLLKMSAHSPLPKQKNKQMSFDTSCIDTMIGRNEYVTQCILIICLAYAITYDVCREIEIHNYVCFFQG